MGELNKIQAIHASGYFGRIIEVGAGVEIAASLYSESGASKTVDYSISPYSKESCIRFFGDSGHRSVSREHIRYVADKAKFTEEEAKARKTFVLVTSFQLAREKKNVITHGWIGIYLEDRCIELHVSLKDIAKYMSYPIGNIELIGSLGLNALYQILYDSEKHYIGPFDMVYRDNVFDFANTFETLNQDVCNGLIFKSDGSICRVEEYVRGSEDVIIYKGSFNPIHNSHISLFETCKEKTGIDKGLFSISLETRGKGIQDNNHVMHRIQCINKLGYDVLIHYAGGFIETRKMLRNSKYEGNIHFIMGSDVYDRLYRDIAKESKAWLTSFNYGDRDLTPSDSGDFFMTYFDNKTHFIVSNTDFKVDVPFVTNPNYVRINPERNTTSVEVESQKLSSTNIRTMLSNGDTNIDDCVPQLVKDMVIDYYRK